MGAIYSLLGYDLKTDDPDPITGLTSKQKHIVKSTWNILKKDPKSHGVNLFLTWARIRESWIWWRNPFLFRFFKYHPGYQKYFPFKDVPTDELADSKIFQAHCLNVIYALSAIVDNVDNSEIMVSLLKKNGESHRRRNVPAEAYWVMNFNKQQQRSFYWRLNEQY